jgi:hypothetical protein
MTKTSSYPSLDFFSFKKSINTSGMGLEVWIGTNSAAGTTGVFLQIYHYYNLPLCQVNENVDKLTIEIYHVQDRQHCHENQ